MTKEAPTLNDELTQAAAALSAGLVGVAKADDADDKKMPAFMKKDDKKDDKEDDKKEDDKEEEKEEEKEEKAEKALSAEEITALVTAVVEKALAPIVAEFTGVTKSLDAIEEKVLTSMGFQKASVGVLNQFKDVAEDTRKLARQNVEVSKSLQAEVTTIGEQTAPRKTLSNAQLDAVEKATEVKEIDLDKLNEVTKGMDVADKLTLKQELRAGVYTSLNAAQRKALSL